MSAAPRQAGRSWLSCLVTGNLQTNCYLIHPQSPGPVALVDPGGSAPDIINAVAAAGSGGLGDVLLTHGHADHWAALPELLERWPGARVLCSDVASAWLGDSEANLSTYIGGSLNLKPQRLEVLAEGAVFTAAGQPFTVMSTPGHTPGCSSFVRADSEGTVLICGDVLFAGSVGRTDLPGGSWPELARSLCRLAALPPEALVLPGHGPASTVGRETSGNPYVRQAHRESL